MLAKSHFAALCLALAAPMAAAQSANPVAQGAPNVPEFRPAFAEQTRAPALAPAYQVRAQRFATGLSQPWGIATLPGGAGFLVTEKAGRLRHVAPSGRVSAPIAGLPAVATERQGGLLDVAVGPNFAADRRIYWTYAKPQGRRFATAAARGVLSADLTRLTQVEDIFIQTPASPSPMHYGSRIVFDGAGHAFITTGEHSARNERVLAQDLSTTYGKVVRITLDGRAPASNPFTGTAGARPEIWSYGHRNPQGAFFERGQLWTIEHGPKGGDELNRIAPGRNYGWPVISYGENYNGSAIGRGETARAGMAQPNYYWDPVIAPAGMVRYRGQMFPAWQGDILISSLRPGGIVRLKMQGDTVVGEERLLPRLGRVRDIEVAPDGSLLVALDDRNGQIVRVTPTGG